MKISSFKKLAESVKQMKEKACVAVVCAHDLHTLEGIVAARQEGMIEPVLIGVADQISAILTSLGEKASNYEVIDRHSIEESMETAAGLVKQGKAGVIMKGKLESGPFMKGILNKENDLRTGGVLSVTGFFEMPAYHKLIAVTDIAINPHPDLEGKKSILLNAVHLLHALGHENPKVAVLASAEKVNPKIPETVDGDLLKQMNVNGEISGCIVEGPISFDLATSMEAARIKGYESPVAGDADLLFVPDLTCGNVLVKSMTGMAGAVTAGLVLGAKVPVILVSRAAEASDKYYSLALAAYASKHFQQIEKKGAKHGASISDFSN